MDCYSYINIFWWKYTDYAKKNKRLSIYKINSIEWDGDAYLSANNLAYKYVATYTADVTEPDAATIYDITATAIYTLEGEVLADEDVVTIKKVGVFPISYVFIIL